LNSEDSLVLCARLDDGGLFDSAGLDGVDCAPQVFEPTLVGAVIGLVGVARCEVPRTLVFVTGVEGLPIMYLAARPKLNGRRLLLFVNTGG
jgi:hypothetical protein